MKEAKSEVIYIGGIIILFGILGLYLAINQTNSFSNLFGIFDMLKDEEQVNTTIAPSLSQTSNPIESEETIPTESIVTFETNLGSIKIGLFDKNAPNTVVNFLELVDKKYYDDTTFHRLVPKLLLQGGSRNTINDEPTDDSKGGPGYTISDEINWDSLNLSPEKRNELTSLGYVSNQNLQSVNMDKYFLAMAGNGPNTSGSQFFIILGGKNESKVKELEGKYTVFGKIIEGQSIIDKIAQGGITLTNIDNPRPVIELKILSSSIKKL